MITRRGLDRRSQLEAMDTEGIDAVLFPTRDWACLPIPTMTHASPRPWRAPTTTGFMTFAEPIRPGCLAPG